VGESNDGALRLDFDRRLMLQFRGSVVTSDADHSFRAAGAGGGRIEEPAAYRGGQGRLGRGAGGSGCGSCRTRCQACGFRGLRRLGWLRLCQRGLRLGGFGRRLRHQLQMSLSRNTHANALRGLHFQSTPFEESKIVRAAHGSLFESAAVDLRPKSPTCGHWTSAILSAEPDLALTGSLHSKTRPTRPTRWLAFNSEII
jgi:hypothetical protein